MDRSRGTSPRERRDVGGVDPVGGAVSISKVPSRKGDGRVPEARQVSISLRPALRL